MITKTVLDQAIFVQRRTSMIGPTPALAAASYAGGRASRGMRHLRVAGFAILCAAVAACGNSPTQTTSTAAASTSGSTTTGSTTTGSGSTTTSSTTTGTTTIVPTTPVTPVQSTSGGTLALNIAGTTQGVNYDYLNVAGTARLAGTLVVNFTNSFVPTSGQKFVLVSAAGGLSGAFANLITNGVAVTSAQDATSYSITIN